MIKKTNNLKTTKARKNSYDLENTDSLRAINSDTNMSKNSFWARTLSLKAQVTIFTTIVSALPLLVIGGATYTLLHQFLSDDATKLQKAKVNEMAVDVKGFLLTRKQELESLAKQEFSTGNLVTIQERLKSWKNTNNYYEDVSFVDINGNVLAHNPEKIHVNQKNDLYFQTILSNNKSFISQPIIAVDTASKDSKIILATPVVNSASRRVDGILKTELSGKSISRIINQQQNNGEKYYLIDGTNKVFLASDTSVIGKGAKEVFSNWEGLKVNSVVTKDELITYLPWQETDDIPNLKWQFISSINKDIAFGVQKKLFLILALGMIVTILLAAGIAATIANRMIARLLSANNALKQLAKGKLETRLAIGGKDELTSLGTNINEMAAQLEELLLRQKKEAEQLKQFSHTFISIRQPTNTENLLNTTVKQVRQALEVERVVIYSYTHQNEGNVLAESCDGALNNSQRLNIPNIYAAKKWDNYASDRVLVINSFNDLELASEDLYLIEQLAVKACLIAPIPKDEQIFGFLIVHECVEPRIWQPQEINFIRQLALQIGDSLERISLLEDAEATKNLAIHLSNSWDTEKIYNLAVQDIRQGLKADRVVIYQFDTDWYGKFLAESVVAGFPCAMGVELYEPCLADYVNKYQLGKVQATNDIYQASFTKCYIQQLETFAVKANLVAPIIVGGKLLGLLIAHQCSRPRNWQKSEIELFEQFSRLLGLALERANILATAEKSSHSAASYLEIQQQQQGKLQQQLATLLYQVESINDGDLTVHAETNDLEIAVVADLFNLIVEKLRDIVLQVKDATTKMAVTLCQNSQSIQENLVNSTQQMNYTNDSVSAIALMRNSIKTTIKTANKTTKLTQGILQAATNSHIAIDTTADGITKLQDTIGDITLKIKRLGETSQKISQVVSTINGAAVQTNLLAINAGIEATRNSGGNQGFAVVVEEIGILANRSATAANEIELLLTNIQRETSELTQIMELEYGALIGETNLIAETKINLEQVLNVCQEIDTLAHSMSSATVSQVKLSQQVKHDLLEALKISKSTHLDTESTLVALQGAVDISQQLQASIEPFKIS
jgi:methyl-accepting chemotaxis protein PixJ